MTGIEKIIMHFIKLSEITDDPDQKHAYYAIIQILTQEYLIGDLV